MRADLRGSIKDFRGGRAVNARFESANAFTLRSPAPLWQATLLLLKSGPQPQTVAFNGQPARTTGWSVYGFEFDAATVDLSGQIKVQVT